MNDKTTQFGLFYEPVPQTARKNDPDTSKNAAKKIDSGSIRHRLLSLISHYPQGLATFEMAILLAVPRDYISPHLKPLERGGWVKRSGELKVNPKSVHKVESEVWQVTEKFFNGGLRPMKKSELRRDAIIMCQKQIAQLENNITQLLRQSVPDFNEDNHSIKNLRCEASPVLFCIVEEKIYGNLTCIFCKRVYKRRGF